MLMLHYEDLPDGDKGIIRKAIEEFQNKCLLSYTKTRDNTIVQKFPLPRVLLHGLGVILKLQSTTGSSVTHRLPNLFSRLEILGLRPCKTMPFAR